MKSAISAISFPLASVLQDANLGNLVKREIPPHIQAGPPDRSKGSVQPWKKINHGTSSLMSPRVGAISKRLTWVVRGLVLNAAISLSCFAQQVGLEGNVRLEVLTQNFAEKIPVNLQNGVGGNPMDRSGPSKVQDKRRFSDVQEAYALAFDTTVNPGSPHLSQQFRLLDERNTLEYDLRNELTSDFGEASLVGNIHLV